MNTATKFRVLALALPLATGCSAPAGWLREHPHELGAASLAAFALTVVALPLVVISLPADYFVRDRREPVRRESVHPLLWNVLPLLKNLLGVVFLFAGLAMLVLPGQGLLTILLGLGLINFPGKFALERRIVARPAVRGALDGIRRRAGRPPFRWVDDPRNDGADRIA